MTVIGLQEKNKTKHKTLMKLKQLKNKIAYSLFLSDVHFTSNCEKKRAITDTVM